MYGVSSQHIFINTGSSNLQRVSNWIWNIRNECKHDMPELPPRPRRYGCSRHMRAMPTGNISQEHACSKLHRMSPRLLPG